MALATSKRTQSLINELIKGDAGLLSVVKIGDIVEGQMFARPAKSAYFDLGKFGTGIVYGIEFSNASDIIKNLHIGDTVTAKVVDIENDEGCIELSLAAATKQKAWTEVKNLFETGEIVSVKILGANSGGLVANIGEIKAFLPVSQLGSTHYPQVGDGDRAKILEALRKFVGMELKVKVIDVNPRASKLILSEREVATTNVMELLGKYTIGQIVEGIISGVADFGAFVRFADNPTIEGLVHISELSHLLVENPKEIIKVNDAVKVKIIEIKEGRVSLSLKALQEDPWVKVGEQYKVDTDVIGTVTKFNPFGAFIALPGELQGLLHISEFGSAEEMQKQLQLGAQYTFHIAVVKPEEKRIILKMKK